MVFVKFWAKLWFSKKKEKSWKERERPLKYPAVTSKRRPAVQCPKCFKGLVQSSGLVSRILGEASGTLTWFAVLWWFLVTCSWQTNLCIHVCYRWQWRIFHSLLVSLRWFLQYHTKCATPHSHNCNQSCTWFHLEPHLQRRRKNELQTQKAAKVAKQEKGRMRKEGLKNELPLHFWQTLIFYFLYFLDTCSTYFLLDHPNYPFLLEKHLQHTCLFVDKHNIQSISQHIEMNHFGLKIPQLDFSISPITSTIKNRKAEDPHLQVF